MPLFGGHQVDIFSDPVLKEVAQAHSTTPASVALNFLWFELGVVVIPKTERKERLAENIRWLNYRLTKEEAEKIRGINKGSRILDTKLSDHFDWVDYYA
jgi:diketogulonate reductase-like aldo/keto reductase